MPLTQGCPQVTSSPQGVYLLSWAPGLSITSFIIPLLLQLGTMSPLPSSNFFCLPCATPWGRVAQPWEPAAQGGQGPLHGVAQYGAGHGTGAPMQNSTVGDTHCIMWHSKWGLEWQNAHHAGQEGMLHGMQPTQLAPWWGVACVVNGPRDTCSLAAQNLSSPALTNE